MTSAPTDAKLSTALERWLEGDHEKTVGGLTDVFGEKSFALLFVLLLGVPALPLPTGGATHVFEVIAVLLALQVIVGRRTVWLPSRFRSVQLAGDRQQRFLAALMRLVRFFERHSRPRLARVLHLRAAEAVFGILVIGGSAAAFFAPPFTGLDTLPALGVVVMSLGFLLEDIAVAVGGVVAGALGVTLTIGVGTAVVNLVSGLL